MCPKFATVIYRRFESLALQTSVGFKNPGCALLFEKCCLNAFRRHGLLCGWLRLSASGGADLQAAVVEGGQGVAVADAHDNALGQACFDELIERRFGGLVKRRGGFVEQHHLRLGEQNANKGDALQLYMEIGRASCRERV